MILSMNVRLWGNVEIYISDGVYIGDNTTLFASKCADIDICKDTFITSTYIIDINHWYEIGKPISKCKYTSEKMEIGKNFWIGQAVTILKVSEIGNVCVVGAKSLVNKKFGDEIIIAGIPAKKIKEKE